MKYKEAIFRSDLERFFGENFSVSYLDIFDFMTKEAKLGIDNVTMLTAFFKMFRDDLIDFKSLEAVVGYLYYDLPDYFEKYADKAKQIIRDIAPSVLSSKELVNRLYSDYQNDRFNLYVFDTCLLLMGSSLDPEFSNSSEEERKTNKWIIDRDGNIITLEKGKAEYIKCIEGILNVDNSSLFVPSRIHEKPIDFVIDYMYTNNIPDRILKKSGLDRRYKSRMFNSYTIKKMDVFRLIFILDMPTQVAKEFMTVCGYSFSPLNNTDLFFLDYLNGKYKKVKTLEELNELGKKYRCENFEWSKWT